MKCKNGKGTYEFTASQSLDKYQEPVKCPKCKSAKDVKKVIRSAFPKSQSWKV